MLELCPAPKTSFFFRKSSSRKSPPWYCSGAARTRIHITWHSPQFADSHKSPTVRSICCNGKLAVYIYLVCISLYIYKSIITTINDAQGFIFPNFPQVKSCKQLVYIYNNSMSQSFPYKPRLYRQVS